MQQTNVVSLIQDLETKFISGTTTISEHVTFSPYSTINKIEAYLASKHTSGDVDSLGREKVFFNICVSAANIWYRATDIDRKNIRLKATKSKDELSVLVANAILKKWMREINFGKFLNEWGRVLSRYGSAVLKFTEKDGLLMPKVETWNKLIFDPVEIQGNPVISVLELTPAQLRANKMYDREVTERLISQTRARTILNGTNQDDRTNYVKVYEIHAELPVSCLTGDEKDDETFAQQMHVVSYLESTVEKGQYDEFCLYKGREDDPYMVTHLIREDGRSMAIGAVEHLMEAQWMVNHSMKAIKDNLDLSTKLIFQTSDPNFLGENALASMEIGDILVHSANEPITQVNSQSHDLAAIQNFASQWRAVAQEITSTPDSLRGNAAPSGTAWRQVEALQQEANSLFELMTENKGLYIEEMMTRFVIPWILRKLDSSEEISDVLDSMDIDRIDAKFIKVKAEEAAKKSAKEAVLRGEVPLPTDQEAVAGEIREKLTELGSKRFFKPSEIEGRTWKEVFKGFEWEVEVDVTGEQSFSKDDVATLSTMLQLAVNNPDGFANNPWAKAILGKILSITGAMSPVEMPTASSMPPPSLPSLPAVPESAPPAPMAA